MGSGFKYLGEETERGRNCGKREGVYAFSHLLETPMKTPPDETFSESASAL
jgi:hypothetical protein